MHPQRTLGQQHDKQILNLWEREKKKTFPCSFVFCRFLPKTQMVDILSKKVPLRSDLNKICASSFVVSMIIDQSEKKKKRLD